MKNDLKQDKTDALLRLALEEQMEQDEYLNQYKTNADMDEPHTFSDEHNRKMKKMMKKALRVERHSERHKMIRRIAAAIGLVLVGSITMVTRVEAFRVPLLRFFSNITAESTFFGVQKENNFAVTEKFQEYEPQYIPAGFSVEETVELGTSFYIKYLNDQQSQRYTFYYFENIDNRAVDTEDATGNNDFINGNKAIVIQKGNEIRILMYKDNHEYCVQGNISMEEGYKILESIK